MYVIYIIMDTMLYFVLLILIEVTYIYVETTYFTICSRKNAQVMENIAFVLS